MPGAPYIGNIELPAVSPYPSPPWTHRQLPAVEGYNRHYNPYPTPSPTSPGTPIRLPITPNTPNTPLPSSPRPQIHASLTHGHYDASNTPNTPLPSSPRPQIHASLTHGHYDASNDYNMLSDKSLLNPAVDQSTSSLVLTLPQDLNAGGIVVTPTTSYPFVTVFDIVMAIRKALYAPSQSQPWGTPHRRRVVDSLRGRTRISVRGIPAGPRPVLSVEFL